MPTKDFIPKCLKANGETPLEDSGGVYDYARLLKIAKKKNLTDDEKELIELTKYSAQDIRDFPNCVVPIDLLNEFIEKDWKDIKAGKNSFNGY
jgi:hypothetical protein